MLEDEHPGAAQILVMTAVLGVGALGRSGTGWGAGGSSCRGEALGWEWGSPGARYGSALCDPGQVHLLGNLLLCDRGEPG